MTLAAARAYTDPSKSANSSLSRRRVTVMEVDEALCGVVLELQGRRRFPDTQIHRLRAIKRQANGQGTFEFLSFLPLFCFYRLSRLHPLAKFS